jgi:hypothetical protein
MASKVTILGCGPAGLLAAHAAKGAGHQVRILATRRQMSDMPGAIYIHEPIPGVTDDEPEAHIKFEKLGTREGYALKLYGAADADCSWDSFPVGLRPAWDMKRAYEGLWGAYSPYIEERLIDVQAMAALAEEDGCVISSIPPTAYCPSPHHRFKAKRVWIEREHRDICEMLGDPCVIYNGQESDAYYRTSLLFGHGSTEHADLPHNRTVYEGFKPLYTNCDCHPGVLRVGRFGQWKRGVLVHEAYDRAREALRAL